MAATIIKKLFIVGAVVGLLLPPAADAGVIIVNGTVTDPPKESIAETEQSTGENETTEGELSAEEEAVYAFLNAIFNGETGASTPDTTPATDGAPNDEYWGDPQSDVGELGGCVATPGGALLWPLALLAFMRRKRSR